ncbi:MAG: PEGA domain-containing protein [Archangium sp.]
MRWVLLLVLVSSVAFAQTARSLFDEGTALYAKGQFANAALKFEASFAVRPVPVTRFNIARAWEQAGETLKAIDAWQGWLAMSPSSPQRPEAEAALETLGGKLAKLGVQAVTINSLPLGARVFIDGVAAGVTPRTVELTPTRHLLRIESDGRAPVERTMVVALEHPAMEFFELAPGEAAPAPPPLESALLTPTPLGPAPLPSPTVPRSTDPEFAFAMSDDTVQVHLETSDKNVRLLRLNGNPNGECRAPCDTPINRASERFVIGGDGITPSTMFVLIDHARNKRVSMRVKAGSAGWFVGGGTVFTTLSALGFAFGTVFAVSPRSESPVPAALGFGVGGTALIAAILSFALSGTSITFE